MHLVPSDSVHFAVFDFCVFSLCSKSFLESYSTIFTYSGIGVTQTIGVILTGLGENIKSFLLINSTFLDIFDPPGAGNLGRFFTFFYCRDYPNTRVYNFKNSKIIFISNFQKFSSLMYMYLIYVDFLFVKTIVIQRCLARLVSNLAQWRPPRLF